MKKKFIPAYLLTFVNVLGFSILSPVLPFIVKKYGGSEWQFGLLLTFYSAFQFLGAPYFGKLSDSRGRKKVLIWSQAGTLLSWVIFFFALNLENITLPLIGLSLPLLVIGASRILDGITGGNTSVANAYVSDITEPKEKKFIFGYLGGIAGLGMIIGPAIGGIASSTDLGYRGTILMAILISSFTLVSLFLWLKESLPVEKRAKKEKNNIFQGLFILKKIREANPKPFIKLLFLLKFLFSSMMSFYISTISLFMISRFNFDERDLGYFMLFVGLFMSFNQAVVSKYFVQKFGSFNTLILGLSLSFIGLLLLTLTTNLYLYVGVYYIFNLGLSLCFPTFNSLISTHANPKKQGQIMGISESLNSLAIAIFPIISTYIFGLIDYTLYFFMTLLPLSALLISIFIVKPMLKEVEQTEKLEEA